MTCKTAIAAGRITDEQVVVEICVYGSHFIYLPFPPFLEFAIIFKIYQKHHFAKMISRFFLDSVEISSQYHIVLSILSHYVCLKLNVVITDYFLAVHVQIRAFL